MGLLWTCLRLLSWQSGWSAAKQGHLRHTGMLTAEIALQDYVLLFHGQYHPTSVVPSALRAFVSGFLANLQIAFRRRLFRLRTKRTT